MKRAIKFKLKNGKIVTIRRTRAGDYDAQMEFFEKFVREPGALQTWQYAGQPKKDKEKSVQLYESDDWLFIGVWDGNNMIGCGDIHRTHVGNPYDGRVAACATTVLEKYKRNGIGGKMLDIFEKWAHEHNVHKIEAGIRHKNMASINNCLKHGFVITGIKHDSAYINGEWIHEYILEKIIEK